VRLKDGRINGSGGGNANFNSNLVRLKVLKKRKPTQSVQEFQFQFGAIKRNS